MSTGERPSIQVILAEDGQPSGRALYRLACLEVRSNRNLAELAPYCREPSEIAAVASLRDQTPSWAVRPEVLSIVYEGAGWIGGEEVRVRARADGERHHLEIEDGTAVAVFPDGQTIVVRVVAGSNSRLARFAALGPGLALGLALAGCFSLHASAVLVGERALVLMGESGVGKSSLAASAFRRDGCRRIADDVVPVWVSSSGELHLAPCFPQLKLPASDQWLGAEQLACSGLLAVERKAAAGRSSFSALSHRDGVLALLGSTVASRLFSSELRRRELDAWVAVASGNRVLEWQVPDDADRIPEIFESLVSLET